MGYEVEDFSKEVIERSQTTPVVVDFWAPWCGPCKVLGPVLERLAGKSNGDWTLAKVNTDAHPEIAERYGVRGIPNVKLFVDGKAVNEFTGALPEPMVVQWLKKALPDKFRKVTLEAEELIRAGNVEKGRKLLEEVLTSDGGNPRARVLLAETSIYTDPQRAVDLVGDIEEHMDDFPMADAVRTIAGLLLKLRHPEELPEDGVKQEYLDAARDLSQRSYDSAVEKFIDVIRTNRYYDDDGARKGCLAVFRILGDEHEITQKHRRSFSSALYV